MESIAIPTIAFLVIVPAVVALFLCAIRGDKARSFVTVIGALVIACGSVFCAIEFLPQCSSGAIYFAVDETISEVISYVALAIDLLLSIYIIVKGIACKRYIAPVLALCQAALITYFELAIAPGIEVASALYIDDLSIIMVLIIGIIGSGICVYAIGYMRDYQKHAQGKDRRPVFFALMFVFLSAMFGIVLFNNMAWMLCAWEVTTVCSFALIGFTRTDEAIANSFRQIVLNLIGGLAFAIALVWVAMLYGTLEFDQFLSSVLSYAQAGTTYLTYVPLMLLALAAFTKAAQLPFQSWLLGAMVAPTPTSALLHSSTMVKAGVFLLIKLAPAFGMNLPGVMVMFVGGATFLLCALAAINMSNAKRVLAYSTISNLGLITLCAGIGTEAAIWAAIFLLIFHAAAKSLLFLCVGTAEHHIGSRDIEDMDALFERMPMLSRLMALGILGMFIAPFGMLVSKWAALQAVASTSNVVLILILVFGSAATFMFWAKWLGKILSFANGGAEEVESGIYRSEWASLGLMTVLTVGCCIAFPLISQSAVTPYLSGVYGALPETLATGDLWIMAVIALVIAIVFLGFSGATKKRVVDVYMAGAGVDFGKRTYLNSLNVETPATQRNWYMDDFFNEKKVTLVGLAVSFTLLFGCFGYVAQTTYSAKDSIVSNYEAYQTYAGSAWEENGVPFSEYSEYYTYYASQYEEYEDEYNEMGYTSIDQLMDELYEQYEAYMEQYSSYSTDTTGSTEGEAY